MPRRSMRCRSSAGEAVTLYQQKKRNKQKKKKENAFCWERIGGQFIEMQIACTNGKVTVRCH